MKALDKLVMSLYSIIVGIISLVFIILPFDIRGLLSIDSIINHVDSIRGNYTYSLVGLAGLAISIGSLLFIFKIRNVERKKRKDSIFSIKNDFGDITIYDDTVIGLVENVSGEFAGIDKIKTRVNFKDEEIYINIRGEAEEEISIPQISAELQEKVKKHIENATGAKVNTVNVEITKVVNN